MWTQIHWESMVWALLRVEFTLDPCINVTHHMQQGTAYKVDGFMNSAAATMPESKPPSLRRIDTKLLDDLRRPYKLCVELPEQLIVAPVALFYK